MPRDVGTLNQTPFTPLPTSRPPPPPSAPGPALPTLGGAAGSAVSAASGAGSSHGVHFPAIEMPDFSAFIADLEAQRQAQLQEQLQAQAFTEINQLLAQRSNAESEAIRVVDERITQEMDRARLVGLDYNLTDEDRLNRINNLFAEVYSEEADSRLNQLLSQWGGPDLTSDERQAINSGNLAFVPEFEITRGEITGQDSTGRIAETEPAGGRVNPDTDSILELPRDKPKNVLGF